MSDATAHRECLIKSSALASAAAAPARSAHAQPGLHQLTALEALAAMRDGSLDSGAYARALQARAAAHESFNA